MRYVNKFNALQMSGNIIYQHTTTFGNTENGCLWHLQNIDNQYLCFYKTLSYFTGFDREKDSLRLNPQSEGLCGARLTSPLDLFTRFYYFGARYYDCDLSGLFLSVDPMADKYPSLSPYAYCAWNPVKLVDPDGKDTINGTQSKMLSRACKSSYPGMLIFNGHGVPPNEFSPSTSIRFENDRYFAYDGMINMKTSSTIKMFSDFLSEYNDVYKKNTDQGLLTIVILITCRAGTELPIPYAIQENIAQSIAKEMPNAIVIAPSWDVTLNKDGENGNMYVYEDPYRQIYGHWNVYNNGKKIDIINNLNKLDALVQEAQNKTLLYRYLIPTKDE